ncbi:MAG: IPT/TIG domain-containing protein [Burkholderiales bacterium]
MQHRHRLRTWLLGALTALTATCATLAPAATQPTIASAKVSASAPPQLALTLTGSGFSGVATVVIGGYVNLAPATQTDSLLVFNLPQGLPDGTYLVNLKVAGSGPKEPTYYEEAYVTVGAAGPPGPPGPQGATGGRVRQVVQIGGQVRGWG